MGDVLGLHLVAHLDQVSSPRRSVVARLDPAGRLCALVEADDDDAVIALVEAQSPVAAIVVDAPLEIPNAAGRRDAEHVLAWCDVPAFPVSARRMEAVFGGARGVRLAPSLCAGGRLVMEALPDQVLRQIVWEAERPAGTAPLDLADYRALWPAVRAPRYRPKGVGRARPEGILAAWGVLARVVDMGGWAPDPAPDDWAAIADAARIDAICCAYAGVRVLSGTGIRLGLPGRGVLALPADANLAARLEATLDRLRNEGAVAI